METEVPITVPKDPRRFPFGSDPEDQKEFHAQVKAEPDLYTMICEAYAPKVKLKNDIFPRPHEIYNCTTCKLGRELPLSNDKNEYTCRCRWDVKLHVGPRFNDIMCVWYQSKVPRPKKGYLPGFDTGKYKPSERR